MDGFTLGCLNSEMYTCACGDFPRECEDARKEERSIAFRDCLRSMKGLFRLLESTRLNDLIADRILGTMRQIVAQRCLVESRAMR